MRPSPLIRSQLPHPRHPTTEVTEAPAESEAEEVDTPATGDFPVPYLAAVLGLILVCSAGLVMLKRI